MVDTFDKATRSAVMARIRAKNTGPELAVRKITFALGFRYRLHRKDLPGKPDLVFPARKKVIFVHGCFWHQHHCRAGRLPNSNKEYWGPKLAKNVERDKQALEALQRLGWQALTIWECELHSPMELADRISTFLSRPNARPSPSHGPLSCGRAPGEAHP